MVLKALLLHVVLLEHVLLRDIHITHVLVLLPNSCFFFVLLLLSVTLMCSLRVEILLFIGNWSAVKLLIVPLFVLVLVLVLVLVSLFVFVLVLVLVLVGTVSHF